jgi:hypothetical protein
MNGSLRIVRDLSVILPITGHTVFATLLIAAPAAGSPSATDYPPPSQWPGSVKVRHSRTLPGMNNNYAYAHKDLDIGIKNGYLEELPLRISRQPFETLGTGVFSSDCHSRETTSRKDVEKNEKMFVF